MSIFDRAFATDPVLSFEAEVVTPETPQTSKREDEVVIYAKINDFTGLKKAQSKESHEQWEVKAPFGRIRIRKTTIAGLEPTYKQAIKRKDDYVGIAGGTELETVTDQAAFDAFRAIADAGMIKDRYVFVPTQVKSSGPDGASPMADVDLKYEVDVFPDGHGGYHQWCKIDIEVNNLLDKIAATQGSGKKIKLTFAISGLPFKPSEIVVGSSEKLEDKTLIDTLYNDIFRVKKNAKGDLRTGAGRKSSEALGLTTAETTEVDSSTQSEPVATTTPVPVGDNEETTTLPKTQADEQTTEEVAEEKNGTPEVVEEIKPSIDEENKAYIQEHLEQFKGKTFSGSRSGNVIKFTDDAGQEHELKSEWGVRGINIPTMISFDDKGELKETMKRNSDGVVEGTKE